MTKPKKKIKNPMKEHAIEMITMAIDRQFNYQNITEEEYRDLIRMVIGRLDL